MNESRLALLAKYLEEDPHDPFNIYAIATEYKREHPEKAIRYYEQLLTDHPEYLPTYYHAAETYQLLDQTDQVEEVYKKGIELAKSQKETTALRELQNAYNEFLFE